MTRCPSLSVMGSVRLKIGVFSGGLCVSILVVVSLPPARMMKGETGSILTVVTSCRNVVRVVIVPSG